MFALTKKTDYALIALSHLARHPDRVVSAREIAASHHVPLSILTNILKTLAHHSIVLSERGVHGGYILARPAEDINLLELINGVEGSFRFVQCITMNAGSEKGTCELEPTCSIRLPAHRIHDRLKQFLETLTLADIALEETRTVQLGGIPEPARTAKSSMKEYA